MDHGLLLGDHLKAGRGYLPGCVQVPTGDTAFRDTLSHTRWHLTRVQASVCGIPLATVILHRWLGLSYSERGSLTPNSAGEEEVLPTEGTGERRRGGEGEEREIRLSVSLGSPFWKNKGQ